MILDTDILSVLSMPKCPTHLTRRLRGTYVPLYISSITWAEACFGIARLPADRGRALRRRYEEAVLPYVRVLDFTQECAEVYGRLRAELARQGKPLDDADLMIASIALRHGMTLITGNTRHFSRVPGLRVENWLAEEGSPEG